MDGSSRTPAPRQDRAEATELVRTREGGDDNMSSLRLLTVDDVAAILHVSSRSIRRMIAAGQIRVIRLGRVVRVHPVAVQEILDNNCQ